MTISHYEIIVKEKKNPLLKVILFVLFSVLLVHFFVPIFFLSLGIAAMAIKGLIAFLILATVGVFLLPFIGFLFGGIWVLVCTVVGIALFPVLLPAIFSIVLFLALMRWCLG